MQQFGVDRSAFGVWRLVGAGRNGLIRGSWLASSIVLFPCTPSLIVIVLVIVLVILFDRLVLATKIHRSPFRVLDPDAFGPTLQLPTDNQQLPPTKIHRSPFARATAKRAGCLPLEEAKRDASPTPQPLSRTLRTLPTLTVFRQMRAGICAS